MWIVGIYHVIVLIDGLMAIVFQPSSVVVPTVSPISVDHQPSRNHQTTLEAVYRPRYSTSSCRSLILGMLHGFLDLHPLCWARTTIVDRRQRQVTSRQDTIFGNQSEKRKHFPFRFLRSVILTVNLGRTPPPPLPLLSFVLRTSGKRAMPP